MHKAVLSEFPQADALVAFVWIDMVAGDSRATADSMADGIRDSRAEHFHDVNKGAGNAIGDSLGGSGEIAWDTCLLYPPAIQWLDRVYQPLDWAHHLQVASPLHPVVDRALCSMPNCMNGWKC